MQFRRLGDSGLQLSALSLGAWITFGNQLGRGQARELVALAWDQGVNFFDNAEGYAYGEAEQIMGDVIADLRLPRDGFCVSSKVFFGSSEHPSPTQKGLSRKHVRDACHAALGRLRVEYLDLFYCHRPDPDTPIAETVSAMDILIRQGKVLYWGTSEWSAPQVEEAHRIATERGMQAPTMEQPQYNLLHRQRVEVEYAPLYNKYGMGLTTWSPLASGVLTGKYNEGIPAGSRMAHADYAWLRSGLAERIPLAHRFSEAALSMGVAPAQLAIAWCLRNPHVSSVILGASSTGQLSDNLLALDVFERITEDQWKWMEAAVG